MADYDYDVIVVGGGPAGVITAIQVARENYSCVILDKKSRSKIGDKNCGDALDRKHSKILEDNMGIAPPSLQSGEARDLISTITIAASSLNSKFSANTPGHQVNRLVYGQRLLDLAEQEGVEIRDQSTVRGIIKEDGYIRGVTYFDKNRNKNELRAKITVDASGFTGTVRKLIPKEMSLGVDLNFQKEYSIATYREIIELKSENDHNFREEIVLMYHPLIPIPGYAWIFTEGEKKLNIGVTWLKSDEYPENKSLKDIYHEIFNDYFDPNSYEILDRGGGNIPGRPNFDTLVVNGAMITGDAGGLADPTTFEGHGPALESGRLAGKVAVKALDNNSFSYKDLWDYNKMIMDYPGGMHAQSFIASRFIREIGVDNVQFLLDRKIITREELEEIFKDPDQKISFWLKLKKFIMAFPKWGLMLKLRNIINHLEEISDMYDKYPENPEKLDDWRKERDELMGYKF